MSLRAMIDALEQHTSEMGSWSIEANDQRGVYETVDQHLKNHPDLWDFRSEAERQQCIERNVLYGLRWYMDTPSGFYSYAAPSMALLASYFLEVALPEIIGAKKAG